MDFDPYVKSHYI